MQILRKKILHDTTFCSEFNYNELAFSLMRCLLPIGIIIGEWSKLEEIILLQIAVEFSRKKNKNLKDLTYEPKMGCFIVFIP